MPPHKAVRIRYTLQNVSSVVGRLTILPRSKVTLIKLKSGKFEVKKYSHSPQETCQNEDKDPHFEPTTKQGEKFAFAPRNSVRLVLPCRDWEQKDVSLFISVKGQRGKGPTEEWQPLTRYSRGQGLVCFFGWLVFSF